MKAIILAAGYATRLYPLTENKSKALLSIGGKPIISHIVDSLVKIEALDKIYVISNSRFYGDFVQWQRESGFEMVEVLDDGTDSDENKLGAIGDIDFVIRNKNIDDDLFIIAGDSFFTFELQDFYKYYKTIDRDCVCAKELDDLDLLRRFAVAGVDSDNKITDLVEKPSEPQSNLGVYASYIYTKNTAKLVEKYLADGNKPDAPGFFLQWLYDKKDVYIYKIDGEIFDIGTPESYRQAQERFGE